jgi:putative membrane protein
MHLIIRLLINAAALLAAVWLIPGIDFGGGLAKLIGVAVVFGIVNALVRPILTVLSCPLIVVTLGLFTLVINALLLLLTGYLSQAWNLGFRVDGFLPAFLGGIVIGLVSTLLTLTVGRTNE